jgi:hypothetical protein
MTEKGIKRLFTTSSNFDKKAKWVAADGLILPVAPFF